HEQAGRDAATLQRREHLLCLVEWYDRVVFSMQEYDRIGESLDEVDGRAVMIECAAGPVWFDQPIQIVQLELMRIGCERGKITDAIIAGAGGKFVMEGEGAQRRVAARAPARDQKLVAGDVAALGQILGAGDAIRDIDDAPPAVKLFAISPAVSGAPPVIHVENRKAAACPELQRKTESGVRCRCRSAVALHQQGG